MKINYGQSDLRHRAPKDLEVVHNSNPRAGGIYAAKSSEDRACPRNAVVENPRYMIPLYAETSKQQAARRQTNMQCAFDELVSLIRPTAMNK